MVRVMVRVRVRARVRVRVRVSHMGPQVETREEQVYVGSPVKVSCKSKCFPSRGRVWYFRF